MNGYVSATVRRGSTIRPAISLGIGVPLTGAGTIRADLVAREGSVYALTTSGRLFKADPKTQTVNEVTIAGARQ